MIIVTGAYGFIGSNMVHELNRRGYDDLILVDDLTDGRKYRNLLGARWSDYYDVDEFFERFNRWNMVSAVYHQGAISSTVETDGRLVMGRNYRWSKDLFTRCIQYQIPVSYASSASVYGNRQDQTLDPLNLYAYSKMLVDQWVMSNIKRFRLVQGWRYYNVYGNGEAHKNDQCSPITKFTRQALTTGEIRLFEGSDTIYRDFIAVEDVARVVLDSLQHKHKSGIRDLGTGAVMSFDTVARIIQRKHGGEIVTVPFPESLRAGYQYLTKSPVHPEHKCWTLADWLDQKQL